MSEDGLIGLRSDRLLVVEVVRVRITALRVRPYVQHQVVVQQLGAVFLSLRPQAGDGVVPEGFGVVIVRLLAGDRRVRLRLRLLFAGSGAVRLWLRLLLARGGARVARVGSHRR